MITDKQLRQAIMADFRELYVKEFSTGWKTERTLREIELGLMPLTHTLALVNRPSSVKASGR